MKLLKIRYQLIGFYIPFFSIFILALFMLLTQHGNGALVFFRFERMVEIIVPLGFGLHAGFLVALEIDQKMEIPMVCKRSLSKEFLNRFLLALLPWSLIGVLGGLVTFLFSPKPLPWMILLTWFPAAILLGGLTSCTAILTKQSIFGVFLGFLMWGGMLIGGDALRSLLPVFELIHLFLDPLTVSPGIYFMNRILITVFGGILVLFSYLMLQKEERFLL